MAESSVLSDIWSGIKQGIAGKVRDAETRLEKSTGVTPEQGNTGAYFGLGIVDTISGILHGKADDLQKRVLESGTGKSLVSQATQNQVAALIGDWRFWAIIGGLALLFMFMGGAIRSAMK